MSHINRRTFLKNVAIATGGFAVASELLPSPVLAQQDSPLRPDPSAKRGGTLRYAVHSAAAHFDIHQSAIRRMVRRSWPASSTTAACSIR